MRVPDSCFPQEEQAGSGLNPPMCNTLPFTSCTRAPRTVQAYTTSLEGNA